MLKRKLTAVLLACALCLFTACPSKTTLLSSATDVLNSLQAAQPLIEQLLPKAKAPLAQGLSIAVKMRDAVKANDANGAAAYLAALIPTFQTIVRDDLPSIKDPAVRTEIMVALALADIALSYLANHLQSNAPAAMSALPNASAVADFAAAPVWGLRYKRK